VFETLSDRLTSVFSSLRSKGKLSEADINATAREIRVALLEADVALPVVKEFIDRVKERARDVTQLSQANINPAQQVVRIVNDELIEILGGETRRLRFAKTPPSVIMLAGLQGSGKTTLAGKLARWLKAEGHTPLLVAADLQRPNAVTQLQVVGERAGVPVYAPAAGNGDGDPVHVARTSVDHARHAQHDVVIIDTAGRLGIDAEMMQQAIDIRDAVSPDEILFVVDAMVGQDAVNTATAFLDGVGFDGVALTKLDGDARGGAALSVRHITGRPIMFASTGEKLEDFDVFHPERMAGRILDMGDILTLIEQAEKAFDAEQAERMTQKFTSGEDFTLEDFLEQMMMIRKLGPIGNLLGMLPGMGQMRQQIDQIDDKDLDRVAAIIRSMTPQERAEPKIINGSRRARIARGSGVSVGEVNSLVTRFFDAQKMMRKMAGGMGGMGIPGMPGARRKPAKSAKAKKGRQRSGDPRKRAMGGAGAQEAAPAPQQPGLPPALGGGLPGQLPPGFQMPDLGNLGARNRPGKNK
jgi:signal recognition particle subunit SRP54